MKSGTHPNPVPTSEPCTAPQIHHLGIDVKTKDAAKLRHKLRWQFTTQAVRDGGPYHEDESYSQIHVDTDLTESQMDEWLYTAQHGCEYVGVFVRRIPKGS